MGATAQHRPARVLIVPGLNDSGPGHWQTWLQAQYHDAVRVVQHDWAQPDLERWSARIASTLERAGAGPWLAVGHSFGCLALAHHLARGTPSTIVAALLVAPADPDKFGVAQLLPHHPLPVSSTLVASDTDPWMSAASALRWAARWGSHWLTLGDAGHINAESGFGPLPFARRWVVAMERSWNSKAFARIDKAMATESGNVRSRSADMRVADGLQCIGPSTIGVTRGSIGRGLTATQRCRGRCSVCDELH